MFNIKKHLPSILLNLLSNQVVMTLFFTVATLILALITDILYMSLQVWELAIFLILFVSIFYGYYLWKNKELKLTKEEEKILSLVQVFGEVQDENFHIFHIRALAHLSKADSEYYVNNLINKGLIQDYNIEFILTHKGIKYLKDKGKIISDAKSKIEELSKNINTDFI